MRTYEGNGAKICPDRGRARDKDVQASSEYVPTMRMR